MKRKIISFILAVCLIVPCLVMLSACGQVPPELINVSTMAEFNQALTTAKEGDTIVLNANLDLQEVNNNVAIKITSGKHILDLNGYTIKGVDNPSQNSWHVFDVRGEDTELTIKDTSQGAQGKIEGRVYGIQVSRGAKLTIESGQFICTQNGTYNQSVVVYGGELVINGGAFYSKNSEIIYSSSYTFDNVDYHNKVTINGGLFRSLAEEMSKDALLVFEREQLVNITEKQVVEINGGNFQPDKFIYIVTIDNYVTFTNNAEIPQNKIEK